MLGLGLGYVGYGCLLRAHEAGGSRRHRVGSSRHCRTILQVSESLAGSGLAVVVQQWTQGKNPAEHADSFERQYKLAALLKPMFVNSHTVRDFFGLDENLLILDRAVRLESEMGIQVFHKTHRGHALFSASATAEILRRRPEVRLTADLSHRCCVHESLLEDQGPSVQLAVERAHHIHTRVGFPEGPQIPDPRDPLWEPAMLAHLGWWRSIVEQRRADRCEVQTDCPEFGPAPYMTVLPNSGQPIADLWSVNCYMRGWVESRLRI